MFVKISFKQGYSKIFKRIWE